MTTGTRVLVAALIGFAIPVAWWAAPGGRGFDSLARALLAGVAGAALTAAFAYVRAKSSSGALAAGRALRERHDRGST